MIRLGDGLDHVQINPDASQVGDFDPTFITTEASELRVSQRRGNREDSQTE